jgi:hypothetical protein
MHSLFTPSSLISRFRTPVLLAGLLLGAAGIHVAEAQLLSFPGAEGAGRFTTGGRGRGTAGTTVYEVTSLADTNTPGTLRYAISQSAASVPARTIVFRVCGTIHLTARMNIPRNTTIAGQTAPGDGICIADRQVSIGGDNVIVRFVRFRLGDRYQKLVDASGNPVNGSGDEDALNGIDHKNIIIDHCSVSWSADEAFTFYGAAADSMTLQWNIISEPLNYSYHFETGDADYERHGYGGIWGGQKSSFHHNLLAHCLSRTPRWNGTRYGAAIGTENCDFRNNVIYNWGSNNVYGGEGGNYNMVNNYYKYGPNTATGSTRSRIVNPYKQTTAPLLPYPRIYLTGNYVDGSTTNTLHNWRGASMNGGSLVDTVQSKSATEFSIGPVTTQSAADAYNSVLQGAGCVLPARDLLDQRILNDVRNRTGAIIDVQGGFAHGTPYAQTSGAWPVLTCGNPPADTDHDGMPDAWETSFGLNPNDATDRNTRAANGYPNLENYLNGLVASIITAARPGTEVAEALRLFPNPVAEQLTLGHPVAGKAARVAVYNFVGQQVANWATQPGTQETHLNMAALAKGNYLVVYTDAATRLSARCVRE